MQATPSLGPSPATAPRLPSVAVIIPTYNRWPLVAEAIDSALGQSYPNRAVVVVDDASTDGTAEQIRQRYGSSVTLIAKTANEEKCRARNDGIRAATADLVCMLDSDDLLLPDGVQDRVKVFLDDPAFSGVAYGATETGATPQEPARGPSGDILAGYLENPSLLNNNAYMVRRADMLRIGLYRPELTNMEDRELLIRLCGLLEFRFCGTRVQRVRRSSRSARSNYDKILRQGKALTAALRQQPDLASRLAPHWDKIRWMEDRELAAAYYKSRRYAEYIAFFKQIRPDYEVLPAGWNRLRKRCLFARLMCWLGRPGPSS
jgi:glycosyltransferase involved in cell wall biosynthesis